MRLPLTLAALLLSLFLAAQTRFPTLFEKSGGSQSPTYPEIIRWWEGLAGRSPLLQLRQMGPTDAGAPLHLVLVSGSRTFDPASARKKGHTILFVNNGIHPGEPDGIDASMLLVRDIVLGKYRLPDNVLLALIPVYNIGGALNRSPYYRVDQNGPTDKGFRGNSQNLDLNRDFIKCDARESVSFTRIFRWLDPDVFVDNHVSNGADYQHVMTLLTTQHNKLGGIMGTYLKESFEPALYPMMKAKGFDLAPYVNHWNAGPPDAGWPQFFDGPRYSSGYACLWNTFAFVPETHMLKPYPQRVAATRAMMECFIEYAGMQGSHLQRLRREAREQQLQQKRFPLAWRWDRSQSRSITFKGYEASYRNSLVSGKPRLFYDRNRPFEKQVPFFDVYRDSLFVDCPDAYIIPQGWWKVIGLLEANGIKMRRLERDTVVEVETYRIEQYTAAPRPYEGHHPNSNVQVSLKKIQKQFRKGDYWIHTKQAGRRFLVETLEPQGEDSYFAWNFFDPILGAKEGFSDYVFEETAATFLEQQPDLRRELEERRHSDSAFAQSAQAQLYFIYQRSPYREPEHLRYPVFRVRFPQPSIRKVPAAQP